MRKVYAVAALVGSVPTLLCCFLPIVLVSLGLGSALAGVIGAFPQLTWFSEHKFVVFATAAIVIALSGVHQWRNRYAVCPSDPKLAEGCMAARKWSQRLFFIAVTIYLMGFFSAFVFPAILGFLGSAEA